LALVAGILVAGVWFMAVAGLQAFLLPDLEDGVETPESTVTGHLYGIGLLLATLLAYRIASRRPIGWLGSVAGRLRWRWLAVSIVAVLPLGAACALAEAWHTAEPLGWRPSSLLLIVAAVVLVPLQATAEECFGRGLLVQAIAGFFKNERVGLVASLIVSSAVFAALHGVASPWSATFFFGWGVLAWWLTYRTGGLEATIALHAVNNLTLTLATEPWLDYSDPSVGDSGAGPSAMLMVGLLSLAASAIIVDVVARRRLARGSALG
jgi:membrane protease YdiL (CAAX protease family)